MACREAQLSYDAALNCCKILITLATPLCFNLSGMRLEAQSKRWLGWGLAALIFAYVWSAALARVPHMPRISFAPFIGPGPVNESFQVNAWSPSEQEFRFGVVQPG
jgi:hypothetical protein